MPPPTLAEIPVEVLIDNFLPALSIPDILHLTCTNKFFATVCSDDTFWKRRLDEDYNFSAAMTARVSGWKIIYRGLFKPRVYVWGERSHGRLGLSKFPKTPLHHISFPTELCIPESRIVSLVAGGMSFHALDSQGRVYVWGTLDGTSYAFNRDGFSEPGKGSSSPLRLQLPDATRSISCGRLHASSLDSKNRIWTFLSWGRPFWSSSPLLTDPTCKFIQVECGWGFSCALTQRGDVFVWWPFSGMMKTRIDRVNSTMDEEGDKMAVALPGGTIPCVTWDLNVDPIRLPELPPLPDLSSDIDGEQELTRLVKVAGLDAHIVGLTNKGHVLKIGALDNERTVSQGRWEYLPEYSEVGRLSKHPALSRSGLASPRAMRITHVSANFQHFIAYSAGDNSIVLMGDTNTNPDSEPKIVPELQYKGVISVELGDYHNVALTSTGKVLTWGAYSAGALGLGDPTTLTPGSPGAFESERRRLLALERGRGEPPDVEVPTEVKFDHGLGYPKNRFCFSVTAAGWHTGALIIDLEPGTDSEEKDFEFDAPDEPPRQRRTFGPGETLPFLPHLPGFRIGYAGRGGGGLGGFYG